MAWRENASAKSNWTRCLNVKIARFREFSTLFLSVFFYDEFRSKVWGSLTGIQNLTNASDFRCTSWPNDSHFVRLKYAMWLKKCCVSSQWYIRVTQSFFEIFSCHFFLDVLLRRSVRIDNQNRYTVFFDTINIFIITLYSILIWKCLLYFHIDRKFNGFDILNTQENRFTIWYFIS